MARTRAQRTRSGKKNYGKNYARGRKAEKRTAANLRRQGYSAHISKGSRGSSDVTATKNGRTRRIQVKNITSRSFSSDESARRRMKGEPYNVKKGQEVWVYDKSGRLHKFVM